MAAVRALIATQSSVKLRHGCPGHALETVQINSFRMFYAQQCASRHRFLRSAEPDIHLQSRALKGRHRMYGPPLCCKRKMRMT
jgi:hypothetical protein